MMLSVLSCLIGHLRVLCWNERLLGSFVSLKNWVVFLFCKSSLYVLGPRPLPDTCLANIFSHSVRCLFTFLLVSFTTHHKPFWQKQDRTYLTKSGLASLHVSVTIQSMPPSHPQKKAESAIINLWRNPSLILVLIEIRNVNKWHCIPPFVANEWKMGSEEICKNTQTRIGKREARENFQCFCSEL